MKKLILVLSVIMLAVCTNGYSQKDKVELKCKFDVEKKDAFTGVDYKSVRLAVQFKTDNGGDICYFDFVKKGTEYTLKFEYIIIGNLLVRYPKDGEFLVKLANGELLHLFSTAEITPNITSGSVNYSKYIIPLMLTFDDVTKISTSNMSVAKITIGNKEIEIPITEKIGEKIQNICKCLLK